MAKGMYVGAPRTTHITSSNSHEFFVVTTGKYTFQYNTDGNYRTGTVGALSTAKITFEALYDMEISYYYLYIADHSVFKLLCAGSTIVSAMGGGTNRGTYSLKAGETIEFSLQNAVADAANSSDYAYFSLDVTEESAPIVARKVLENYAEVNGVARRVKKCYTEVDGVARKFFAPKVRWEINHCGYEAYEFMYDDAPDYDYTNTTSDVFYSDYSFSEEYGIEVGEGEWWYADGSDGNDPNDAIGLYYIDHNWDFYSSTYYQLVYQVVSVEYYSSIGYMFNLDLIAIASSPISYYNNGHWTGTSAEDGELPHDGYLVEGSPEDNSFVMYSYKFDDLIYCTRKD